MDDALSVAGGGVMLVGAPGVGKTRLAREALERLSSRGVPTAWAVGSESSRELPLGAFAGMLSRWEDAAPSQSVTERLAEAIRNLAPRQGALVLGVDDVNLLDQASVVLVHQLATQGVIRVVMTQRACTPSPDAVSALLRSERMIRIDLAEIPSDIADGLIDASLDAPVDRAARRALRRAAGGNPLYLRELLRGGLEEGWLAYADGLWQLTRPLRLPSSLVELVSDRIGAVEGDVGELLDILALAEPLSIDLSEHLVGGDVVELVETHGLVSIQRSADDRDFVRLAHPLFGEARRAVLGAARARRLRRRAAGAMADPALGHSGDVMRRAVLELDAGDRPQLELLLAAVDRAADLVDVPLAHRLATAAIGAGAGFETQAYVANLAALVPGEDPVAELDRLEALAGDEVERARAAAMRIAHIAWERNGPQEAEAELRRARSALSDPIAIAHIDAIGALFAERLARSAEASATAERLLAMPGLDRDSVALATSALVAARAGSGRVEGLAPFIERALADSSTLARGAFRTPLIASYALGLEWAGRLDAAEQTKRDLVGGLRDSGPVSAVAAYLLGANELARGRPRSAVALLREAKAGLIYFGGWKYATQIAVTRALALCGTPGEAVAARDELNARVLESMRHWEPDRLLANAMVEARLGAVAAAIALIHQAARFAREHGLFANEVIALQMRVMLGRSGADRRLSELAGIVDGPRVGLALAHDRALSTSDPGALLSVSDAWDEMGDQLAAATASAQSFRLASRGRQSAADRRHVARARIRTMELLLRCEEANTPELDRFARPSPLTDREREVVHLAATGKSNRQIAGQLGVSVRTIEGHVYRATDKLGLTRAEFSQYHG